MLRLLFPGESGGKPENRTTILTCPSGKRSSNVRDAQCATVFAKRLECWELAPAFEWHTEPTASQPASPPVARPMACQSGGKPEDRTTILTCPSGKRSPNASRHSMRYRIRAVFGVLPGSLLLLRAYQPTPNEPVSQRDSATKPRVARDELPWDCCRREFPTSKRLRPLRTAGFQPAARAKVEGRR